MQLRASKTLLIAFLSPGFGFAASSHAETLTFNCKDTSFGKTSDLTLVYEGDSSGTLNIKGTFGEMALPASKEIRADQSGTEVTGIRASGAANVLMPEKAAIEACVNGKLKPEELKDEDIVYMAIGSCAASAPIGKEPVAIKGYAEIAVMEPPSAYVFVTRTYADATPLAGGVIKLETLPPPDCQLAK